MIDILLVTTGKAQVEQMIHSCAFPTMCVLHFNYLSNTIDEVHIKFKRDFSPSLSLFSQNGVEHVHAFISSPEACRFCDVEQNLNGKHNHTHNVDENVCMSRAHT